MDLAIDEEEREMMIKKQRKIKHKKMMLEMEMKDDGPGFEQGLI